MNLHDKICCDHALIFWTYTGQLAKIRAQRILENLRLTVLLAQSGHQALSWHRDGRHWNNVQRVDLTRPEVRGVESSQQQQSWRPHPDVTGTLVVWSFLPRSIRLPFGSRVCRWFWGINHDVSIHSAGMHHLRRDACDGLV
jgi:hypothetical protein